MKDPTTDEELSTNNLMEEIKPIVIEKNEYEGRSKSNLVSFLAFFDY